MADFGSAFASFGAGIASGLSAKGYKQSAKDYLVASDLEEVNVKIARAATGIEKEMVQRQVYKAVGGQRSDVTGAGFRFTGSALDLARDSAEQGALSAALIQNQGAIEEQNHRIQAFSHRSAARLAEAEAAANTAGGIFNIIGGVLSLFSDQRLKRNIVRVGQDEKGTVYEYSYIGDNRRFRGYMAQEIEQYDPEAITDAIGFKSVSEEYRGVEVG